MEIDGSEIEPLIDDLSLSIDDLEEAFQPLFESSLEDHSSKLPLLDKAKLHLLLAYSIHSLVFSSLKLDRVDAKEHAVFSELTRIKQYFEKIKTAEDGPSQNKSKLSVDKDAAGRIIKHALSSQQSSSQKQPIHTRFNESDPERDSKLGELDAAEDQGSASETDEKDDRKRKRNEDSSVAHEEKRSMSEDQQDESTSIESWRQQSKRPEKPGKRLHHGRMKSSQAPKSSSAVFQHLLNKPK